MSSHTLNPNAPGGGRPLATTLAAFSSDSQSRRGGAQASDAGLALARMTAPSGRTGQDPFAAYLAWRPKTKQAHGHDAKSWVSPMMGSTRNLITDVVPVSFYGRLPDPENDAYASFMSTRPKPPEPSKETSEAELRLREDVLRTKRQLLEVALQAELKLLDPNCPVDMAAKMKQLRRAKRYLRNPERITTVLSDDEDEDDLEMRTRRVGFDDDKTRTLSRSETLRRSQLGSSASAPELISALAGSRRLSSSARLSDMGGGSTAASTAAAAPASSPEVDSRLSLSATLLPPIVTSAGEDEATGTAAREKSPVSPGTQTKAGKKQEPLLSGWWNQTRLWNVSVVKKGLVARRHNWSAPGGAVVLGNGRIPLFTGSHFLHPGNYFCFQITNLDDVNHPMDKVGEMSFGFGVSRVHPLDKSCEKPQYAYEIPNAIVCGYGDKFIDQGRWWKGGWNPKCLKEGDEVGVLVTMDTADMVVFHNDEQVLRMKTSLNEGKSSCPSSPTSSSTRLVKRVLWPIVDLHGRVASVTMQLRKGPPNFPLQRRTTMTRAGVSDVLGC
eukprot:TRINITY_DN31310_c0_g1_i1.p1 TRINITY_DN31310_c0_g1~~TRINITY_DN31310_c0_g1_i1.p1  ORF type:complete len:554 (+),score=80.56 TRINITY_DN31310_c0_g1_i1:90-1751(+)